MASGLIRWSSEPTVVIKHSVFIQHLQRSLSYFEVHKIFHASPAHCVNRILLSLAVYGGPHSQTSLLVAAISL